LIHFAIFISFHPEFFYFYVYICFFAINAHKSYLIDTGWSNKLAYLEKELENLGCSLGNLKLIILTHGNFNHSGNSAYLSRKSNAKIAMHDDDLDIVEHRDTFRNIKEANVPIRIAIKALSGISELIPEKFKHGRKSSRYCHELISITTAIAVVIVSVVVY
jgi:glyoxylase-like metal-dependent hydrolase (beta-lactamase superfamily II)